MAKKTKAGKQHRKAKAKKPVVRKHVAKKQVSRAPQRKPQVAPPAQQHAEAPQPSLAPDIADTSGDKPGQPCRPNLDAPSAGVQS